jgi:deazaflavin-dependent oxidoreductase (nitroreductase family)
MSDWNDKVIAEFRANHGKVGGQFAGFPLLLLHTTGAKSGAVRVNPVAYAPDGDRLLVFASAAGADNHPAWYLNLVANPGVPVQVSSPTSTVTPLPEPDRSEQYAAMAAKNPGFAEYEQKTSRVIPVVALSH